MTRLEGEGWYIRRQATRCCFAVSKADEKGKAAAMEQRPLIADICGQDGAPATISFHDLELATQGPSPAIVGYHYLPAETDIRGVDSRHTKAFIKGHKAAVQVADLFNNNNKIHKGTKDPAPIPMRVTSSGLVKGSFADEEQGQNLHEAILWFEKTRFQFQALMTTGCWTSTHYLHFSNPLSPQTVSGLHDDGGYSPNITLISGVCLFSKRLISASIPKEGHGVHVQALEVPNPTLYEVETIARVAPVIADMIAVLDDHGTEHSNGDDRLCRDGDGDGDGSSRKLSLCLTVPRFHYYQTIDTHLRDGLCTFPQAIQWMDAVDKRHHQIIRVFHRYIQHELSRRPQQRQQADSVHQIVPLHSVSLVCEIIRDSLQKEHLPSLDYVLQMLEIHDPTWTGFYALIPEKDRPRDFQDLGYLFYVYQVVRPALLEQHNPNPQPQSQSQSQYNPLIIGVDDIHERRIYIRAQKLLKRIRSRPEYLARPHLLETYTCNRVFINQNRDREQGKASLYCQDPSPGEIVLKERSLCRSKPANGNGHGCCENGDSGDTALDTFDVISVLYGYHAATVLKGLCVDVGLEG